MRHKSQSLAALLVLAASLLPAANAAAGTQRRSHAPRPAHAACLLNATRRGSSHGRSRATAARVRNGRRSCRLHRRSGHTDRLARPLAAHATSPVAATPATASGEPAAQATVASSRSAAIAAVLAAPCANTEIAPEAGDLALARAAVLCLINRERAQNGIAPLSANPDLEAAAEEHSQELIADDYFAHVSPSGETPVDRIRATGYIPSPDDGYVIGENLAWGTYDLATPQAIVSAWIASPEHLANILEAQYTETGIAVVPAVPASLAEGAPGATYAQEFGVIIP